MATRETRRMQPNQWRPLEGRSAAPLNFDTPKHAWQQVVGRAERIEARSLFHFNISAVCDEILFPSPLCDSPKIIPNLLETHQGYYEEPCSNTNEQATSTNTSLQFNSTDVTHANKRTGGSSELPGLGQVAWRGLGNQGRRNNSKP